MNLHIASVLTFTHSPFSLIFHEFSQGWHIEQMCLAIAISRRSPNGQSYGG